MRPIEHVRALIADVMTSPTYRGGEVRDCIEPYLPLERCNDHQLRAVWLKLDALKRRTANRRTGFTLDELPAVAMASFDTTSHLEYDPFDPFMTETSADEYYWNIKENNHDR
jgi:hypothetical protein